MIEHRRRLPEEALKKRWGAVPEFVFPSTDGGMMNKCSYRRWIEKAAEKAGIERTRLHNLRHSAISLLLNSGAEPFAVQKLAGHSDVRLTTQTYVRTCRLMPSDGLRGCWIGSCWRGRRGRISPRKR